MKLYGIVGAGGFGREVMPLAESMLLAGGEDFQLVFVSEQGTGSAVNGFPLLGMDDFFACRASARYFAIAIADQAVRRRIAGFMQGQGAIPFDVAAASHVRLTGNVIGEGSIFCPFTMVTANATIGRHFHANIYSYVAHDCVIGDWVTFAPGVCCNGNVIIEEGVYVGTGVVIREGRPDRPMVIGRQAVLGMGAVVTSSVPAFSTVVGNPARPLVKREKQEAE